MGFCLSVPRKKTHEIGRFMASDMEIRNIRDLIMFEQDRILLNKDIPDPGPPIGIEKILKNIHDKKDFAFHLIITHWEVEFYTAAGLSPPLFKGSIRLDAIRNAHLVESDEEKQGFGIRILTYTGYSIELFCFIDPETCEPDPKNPDFALECERIFQNETTVANRYLNHKNFHLQYAEENGFDKNMVYFMYHFGLSIDF